MEKLYYYFKDANIEKVKELISMCELRYANDNPELEYRILTDKNLKNHMVKQYFNDKNFKFTFCLTKEEALSSDVAEKMKNLIKELTSNGCKKQSIIFSVLDNTHKFSKSEWTKIQLLNSMLKKQGVKFGFEDHGKTWNIKQVANANRQLNETANDLNLKKLSPFEKIMAAYFKVTSRVYNEENYEKEHFAKSRSVYGILNSQKIVCVGFSEWLSAILDLTGDENIKVYQNGVQVSKDNKTLYGAHRNTVIYVKDKKYNLDGYYYVDSTWDTTTIQNKTEFALNNFMLPLNDINEYRDYIRSDAMFLYLPDMEENDNQIIKFNHLKRKAKNIEDFAQNDKIEYQYGSLLSEKDEAKFGFRDDNNNVSFSTDKYIYDGSFFNDLQKHIMHQNTLKDFTEIETNEKLNTLNDIIDRNKDILDNLKFIKDELKKHRVKTLSNKDIVSIAKSDNYVNTLVDIICNNKNQKSVEYPINQALTKLAVKLNNQQKKLEKEVKNYLNFDFDLIYDESLFNFYTTEPLDKTLKYLSTPISLSKFKVALREYFKKFTNYDRDEIEDKIYLILAENIEYALELQKPTAQNAFAQANVEFYGIDEEDLEEEQK